MAGKLVLSIFPGIDLLGRAFEEEGYCVVRGPDLLWGGDIQAFHPPAGVFEGIIGGPPCQGESRLASLPHGRPGYTMLPEYLRVLAEASPRWWVLEAVVPHPELQSFVLKLSPHWLGEAQRRIRYFHSNVDLAQFVELAPFKHPAVMPTVLASHGGGRKTRRHPSSAYSIGDMCELQGLPRDFTEHMPFTAQSKRLVIGNGVPLCMGRAVARALRSANTEGAAMTANPASNKRLYCPNGHGYSDVVDLGTQTFLCAVCLAKLVPAEPAPNGPDIIREP